MSTSLFNLQREHYTTVVSEYEESVTITSNQTCLIPMYEIVFNSEFKSPGLISASQPSPRAPWKHHTVLSKKIPCTITTDSGETIATWNWQDLTDIPEDLFIGRSFSGQGTNWNESIISGNSLIVDQTHHQVYLKRLFTKVVLTGDEPWEWETGGGPNSNGIRIYVPNTFYSGRYDIIGGCTHFPDWQLATGWETDIWIDCATYDTQSHPEIGIGFFNALAHYSSVEDFKNFLRQEFQKGTPVTCWLISTNWEIRDLEDTGIEFGYTPPLENLTETHPVFANYILNTFDKLKQVSGNNTYTISTNNDAYKGRIKLHYLTTR